MRGRKILIYRRGGLGDTLLTFPLAEIFKQRGWEVHFSGNTDYLKLALEAGYADRIFSELPAEESYERVLLIAAKPFLKHPKVDWIYPFPQRKEHLVSYYLRNLKLPPTFSETLPINGLPHWKGYVILHPGSGSEKKNAPLELFLELYLLLEKKGIKPLFVLGEAEKALLQRLKNFKTFLVEDLVKFAKLLKGAYGFVGNDSGFSHLAGYLGVKTVVLFGPTDPVVWKPLGKNVKVLYKGMDCGPCFPQGCNIVPPKLCLRFKTEEIVQALVS